MASEQSLDRAPARLRISVINDNPEFLELMGDILGEDSGFAVTLHDGEETGIDAVRDADPDLIIVDLLLGGASGWELVTLARADQTLADVPIIVCTADNGRLDRHGGRRQDHHQGPAPAHPDRRRS
jgi:twitching motility two-component system response regulator PilH